MVLIEPPDPSMPTLTTEHIISVIDKHASSTALILLSGIQFYTGQYFDIPTITAHAHSKGLVVGWDCAHAAGNIDLKLHDWDVDFAAWCTYKYLNSGPGAIAGLFVHEKHGAVDMDKSISDGRAYRPRLSGWWGADKSTRFNMDNRTHMHNICSCLKATRLTTSRIHTSSWRSRIPDLKSISPRSRRCFGFARIIF